MTDFKSLPIKIAKNRVVQHSLFWLLSFVITIQFFSNNGIKKIDIIYTVIFHFTLVASVYLNLKWFFPYFFKKRKFAYYAILLMVSCILFSFANQFVFNNVVDYIFPGYYFISVYSFFDLLKFHTVYAIIALLLKVALEWFTQEDAKYKLTIIEKEKAEIELKVLRAQVNPHFLFNSLNVLYSLVLKKSDESPDAIIKLSDILRYVIYDSNKDYVTLKEEIKLISDYLSLQKFRIDSNSKVDFKFDVKDGNLKIAPMLILPLVENSFKHGIKGDIDQTYVEIYLKANQDEIRFEIENNKGISEQIEKDEHSGIGLSNIKNRLNLIYPNKHVFELKENDSFFQIKLIIRNEN